MLQRLEDETERVASAVMSKLSSEYTERERMMKLKLSLRHFVIRKAKEKKRAAFYKLALYEPDEVDYAPGLEQSQEENDLSSMWYDSVSADSAQGFHPVGRVSDSAFISYSYLNDQARESTAHQAVKKLAAEVKAFRKENTQLKHTLCKLAMLHSVSSSSKRVDNHIVLEELHATVSNLQGRLDHLNGSVGVIYKVDIYIQRGRVIYTLTMWLYIFINLLVETKSDKASCPSQCGSL